MTETQVQTTDTEVTVKRRGRPPNPNKVVLQPKTPKVKATEPEPEVVETIRWGGTCEEINEYQEKVSSMMTVAILVDWINNASSIDDENISLTT